MPPRLPLKISLRHEWTRKLGSKVVQPEGKVARQPEGEVVRQTKFSNQPNQFQIRQRTERRVKSVTTHAHARSAVARMTQRMWHTTHMHTFTLRVHLDQGVFNLHKSSIGRMIVGKLVWQQEEVRKGDISIALIILEEFFTSMLFKDILESISLILRYRTQWCLGLEYSLTFTVKGMYPAPHIHEHLRYTNGYGKLRTSSRTTWTTWSTLRTVARTPQSTLTCAMRSSEHAAHRLLMHMCSHIALLAQGLALCVIPYHPCMRTCVLSLEWSFLTRLSTSSSNSSSSFTWCPSLRLMRSPLKIPCATPAWGAWSLWTMSHPSQVMSPRRWSSQTPMSWTSRPPAISTSRTPWTTRLPSPTFLTSTTMSLQNSLQLWSIEQGNLLRWEAIMINFLVTSETWKVLRVSFF